MGKMQRTKGARAELEISKLLNVLLSGHNFKRIGGIERNKAVMLGDVRCVLVDKWGAYCREARGGGACRFSDYVIDVKNRAAMSVPSWWRKVCDDAGSGWPLLIWKNKGRWLVKDRN